MTGVLIDLMPLKYLALGALGGLDLNFVVMPMAFCLIETMGDSIIEHNMIPGSAMKAFL